MKILSLNTWGGKLEKELTSFLLRYREEVEIFCFQEVYPKMRALSAKLLPEFKEVYAYKFVAVADDFHQATYVKKGIDIVDQGTVLMDVPHVGLGLWTEVMYERKPLVVCNYHGMARPGNKLDTRERICASEGLISHFRELQKDRVIIGDFNLLNTVESVTMFEKNGYIDLIKKYGITNTRNKFAWEQHPNSIQYFADFAFLNEGYLETDFMVLPDEVSDHAALLLEL